MSKDLKLPVLCRRVKTNSPSLNFSSIEKFSTDFSRVTKFLNIDRHD